MKNVALHTLGCKLNFAETATFAREFQAKGYGIVGIDQKADVVVLNTCSVTERADRECRQLIRRVLRRSPDAAVIVTGCYAQLQPEAIAAIPGVSLVLGTKEKADLLAHVDKVEKGSVVVRVSTIAEAQDARPAASTGFEDRTRSFLKIQDGCDYSCSFCTIPLARGRSRSIPLEVIVEEAEHIVENGFKEIVLTGVNVGDYGHRTDSSLLMVLKRLSKMDGLERIRVSSIEPNLLSDDLLDFWLSSDRLCRHFHIPLQSGSDVILKGMRRRYVRSRYADRLQRIKNIAPEAGIGSDIIVGFPGESSALFEETYQFLVDMPVSYLHVFTYSERPKTAALEINGKVELSERAKRSGRLRMLGERKRQSFYRSFLGKTVRVLFEARSEDGNATGLSSEYVRVKVRTGDSLENTVADVRVQSVQDGVCWGDVVSSGASRTRLAEEIAA